MNFKAMVDMVSMQNIWWGGGNIHWCRQMPHQVNNAGEGDTYAQITSLCHVGD